jgi:hypothetical protein
MNITSKNYFSTLSRIGAETLPPVLQKAHHFICLKTDFDRDWSLYKREPDFKRIADLTFLKLSEYLRAKKGKPLHGLAGVKSTGKKGNPFADIKTEVYFLEWVLEFHNTIADKKKIGIFIDELNKAIQEKRITKKSPVAKEIRAIQMAAINAFNNTRNVKDFMLKPSTIKRFKSIIEKYKNSLEDIDEDLAKAKKKSVSLEGIIKPEENIMSSVDFSDMHFDTIGFKDKWLHLIGDPSPGFTAMVFGKPKMGKSYLCVDFANYLSLHHGKVLYVSNEEFGSPTLALKLKDKNVANDNLDIAGSIPEDLSSYDFVFLDSVTSLKLSPDDLKKLKEKTPNTSFIYVFQVTKDGKARGANEHTHNVDIVIEVPEKGMAVQYGRFNQGGEMNIFSDNTHAENKEDMQAVKDLDVPENRSTLAGIKKTDMKKDKKLMPKDYSSRTDDNNPKFIFSMTATLLLVEALKGDIDLDYLVRKELANRGLNKEGNWVGFAEAAKIHKIK